MFKTTYDKNSKVWSGRDILPLYNPKISVAQVLLSALSTYGSRIAQVHRDIILIKTISSYISRDITFILDK